MMALQSEGARRQHLRRIIYENGLSIALLACFLALLIGQGIMGHLQYNETLKSHGQLTVTLAEYLKSPHFLEATAENWESEFLQMFVYVLFTVFLYQKGSSESKSFPEPGQEAPQPDVPPRVGKSGVGRKLYENSLSLAFLLMFLISLAVHVIAGTALHNKDQAQHGGQIISSYEYLRTSRFWFEVFQNWQSEFLAIGSMVVLSIFLRQKGSPESKPVDSPNGQTGKE